MSSNIETLERATLDVVAPTITEELPGWLLPMDKSSIGRATSAVPLRHIGVSYDDIAPIETRYSAHGYQPRFRIADVPGLADLCQGLDQHGYRPHTPTLTRVVSVAALRGITQRQEVLVASTPNDAWASVYIADGFDAADGQQRITALSRGEQTLYAAIVTESGAFAAGTATVTRGWLGIHGMRTLPAARAQGYASQIMAAFAERAHALGLTQAFLQVDEGNESANRLYTRLGFETAWRYRYWQKRAQTP